MTTNKKHHCICGKLMSECRAKCCAATLRALRGEWIEFDANIPSGRFFQNNTWIWLIHICDDFEFYWEMMVAVGGVYKVGQRVFSWSATCPLIPMHPYADQSFRADTPEDAVINAYIHMIDRRTE